MRELDGRNSEAELIGGQRLTATTNGTGVDLKNYKGDLQVLLTTDAGGGTTPTLDVKIQDSPDDSTYTDVSGATFTQVTDADPAFLSLGLERRALDRYVRAVATITGTSPTFDMAVLLIGELDRN